MEDKIQQQPSFKFSFPFFFLHSFPFSRAHYTQKTFSAWKRREIVLTFPLELYLAWLQILVHEFNSFYAFLCLLENFPFKNWNLWKKYFSVNFELDISLEIQMKTNLLRHWQLWQKFRLMPKVKFFSSLKSINTSFLMRAIDGSSVLWTNCCFSWKLTASNINWRHKSHGKLCCTT